MSDPPTEGDCRWSKRLRKWLDRPQLREAARNDRCRQVFLIALVGFTVTGLVAPALLIGSGASLSGSSAGPFAGPSGLDTEGHAVGVREASISQQPTVDEQIAALHERGVTGEGTTVGIVGTSFNPRDEAIADAITGYRSVEMGSPRVAPANDASHDTAVAEVVSATAPDADIELVAIGPDPTGSEYRTALQLLVDADVDVIVDAGSYFPRDAETATAFARATDEAATETVLVTSAGNFGERHWSGTTSDAEWVRFNEGSDGVAERPEGADVDPEGVDVDPEGVDGRESMQRDEANRIGDGPIAGDVSLRLHYEAVDPTVEDSAVLYLYRQRPNDPDIAVAKDAGDGGIASIDVAVPRGTYYVAIHRPDGSAPLDLALYSPTHDLQYAVAGGSLPPSVGKQAITVGAEPADGSAPIRDDSSREGVTLVSPGSVEATNGELSGTSAAAPYVGGTAALLVADSDRASAEVRELLLETADRRGNVARVDPGAAVDAADIDTNESHPQRSTDYRAGR